MSVEDEGRCSSVDHRPSLLEIEWAAALAESDTQPHSWLTKERLSSTAKRSRVETGMFYGSSPAVGSVGTVELTNDGMIPIYIFSQFATGLDRL